MKSKNLLLILSTILLLVSIVYFGYTKLSQENNIERLNDRGKDEMELNVDDLDKIPDLTYEDIVGEEDSTIDSDTNETRENETTDQPEVTNSTLQEDKDLLNTTISSLSLDGLSDSDFADFGTIE